MITTCFDFNLIHHNTFAMPVQCARFVAYSTAHDIPRLLAQLPPDEPLLHIGSGSNLLFTGDYPGTVLYSRVRYQTVLRQTDTHVRLEVGAGVEMSNLVAKTTDCGWWGLENLAGIPGQVGAAAVQNVGAYGVEAGDLIVEVRAYDRDQRRFVHLSRQDCRFGYRDSLFKQPDHRGRYIIHAVVFELSVEARPRLDYPALRHYYRDGHPDNPVDVARAVTRIRDVKLPDPRRVPSAGSYFKNPVVTLAELQRIAAQEGETPPNYVVDHEHCKLPAAWLIERCGWKGRTMGAAAVWPLQPLVLTNPDRRATPADIIALELAIVQSVQARFDITLHPEVEKI